MLDGIGKDICLSLAIFFCVLLTAKNNGLCSIDLVDAVDDGIQTPHLFKLLGIEVEKVWLEWAVWPYSHDDDTSFLIVIALAVELLKHFIGSLDNGNG